MVRIIHTGRELEALAPEWDALAQRFATPLLQHDWLCAAAEAFCPPARLAVVLVETAGRLNAAAPLVITRAGGSERLELLGGAHLFEPGRFLYRDADALARPAAGVITLGHPLFLSRLPAGGSEIETLRRAERRCDDPKRLASRLWAPRPQEVPSLIERFRGRYGNIGCTLPVRWRRSLDDVERVRDWGLPVRVVKGEWSDGTTPETDLRTAFLAEIDRFQGHAVEVAVATHNAALASDALARLAASGTPHRLEQLFGLPFHTIRVARRMGVSVRVYVGYGHAWLPYRLSDGLRRPEVLGWFLRDRRVVCHRAYRDASVKCLPVSMWAMAAWPTTI